MSLEIPRSYALQNIRSAVGPRIPISRIPQPAPGKLTPTWRQAKPSRIAASLAVAQAQNSGGWFVAGVSGDVPAATSITRTVAGREIVFWRDREGALVAGPGACPHLGALLTNCAVGRRYVAVPLARLSDRARGRSQLESLPRAR